MLILYLVIFTLHPIACSQDFLPDLTISNFTVRESQAGSSLCALSELMTQTAQLLGRLALI